MYRNKVVMILLALCLTVGLPHITSANTPQFSDTINSERFTFDSALTGVNYINGWLKSFRELTNMTDDRITSEEKIQVGNLGKDIQSLGFYNWAKSVEGTLIKQNYDICKLEYELALERLETGKVNQAEVAEKEKRYQESAKVLQDFLNKFHIAD